MIIFPAIDLYDGKAVRLLRGDYDKMTVYSDAPDEVAAGFAAAGAGYLHVVDLQGARDGSTENLPVIQKIIQSSGLRTEVGGGIRDEDAVKRYLDLGAMRVILGTAAVNKPGFVAEMVSKYGEGIAVGVDIRDGRVAVSGWRELSDRDYMDFCRDMQNDGVSTLICTDISKDGAMSGTNTGLYEQLCRKLSLDIIASGGVSTINDVKSLTKMGLYGAILGKAIYTGGIDLKEAIAAAGDQGEK